MTFTIAIVGRPNVGKSTLFNRLVGRRLALVDDQPGVTRDRREGEGRLGDLTFKIIDTAGLEDAERKTLSGRMQAQTAEALAQADAVLFLVDARDSAMPADRAFADLVRRSGKPTILVANKSEGRAGAAARAAAAYQCRSGPRSSRARGTARSGAGATAAATIGFSAAAADRSRAAGGSDHRIAMA